MSHPRSFKYRAGQHWAECDRCHKDMLASQLREDKQSPGLWVCSDKCWDAKHPQESVKGVPDKQTAPQPIRLPKVESVDNDFDQTAAYFIPAAGTFNTNTLD